MEGVIVSLSLSSKNGDVVIDCLASDDCTQLARDKAAAMGIDVSNERALQRIGAIIEKKRAEALREYASANAADDDGVVEFFGQENGDIDGSQGGFPENILTDVIESPARPSASYVPSPNAGEYSPSEFSRSADFGQVDSAPGNALLAKLRESEEDNKFWEEKCVQLSTELEMASLEVLQLQKEKESSCKGKMADLRAHVLETRASAQLKRQQARAFYNWRRVAHDSCQHDLMATRQREQQLLREVESQKAELTSAIAKLGLASSTLEETREANFSNSHFLLKQLEATHASALSEAQIKATEHEARYRELEEKYAELKSMYRDLAADQASDRSLLSAEKLRTRDLQSRVEALLAAYHESEKRETLLMETLTAAAVADEMLKAERRAIECDGVVDQQEQSEQASIFKLRASLLSSEPRIAQVLELQAKCIQLENELAEMKGQKVTPSNAANNLESTDSSEAMHEKLVETEDALEQQRRTIENLTRELKKYGLLSENLATPQPFTDIDDEESESDVKIRDLEAALQSAHQRLTIMSSKNSEVLKEVRAEMRVLEKDNDTLSERLASEIAEWKAKCESHEAAVEDANSKRATNSIIDAENLTLREALANTEKRLEEALSDLEASKLASAQQELEIKAGQDSTQSLEERYQKEESLRQSLEEMRKRCENDREAVAFQRSIANSLQEQARAWEERYNAALESSNSARLSADASLAKLTQSLLDAHQSASQDAIKFSQEMRQMHAQAAASTSTINSLKLQLAASQEELQKREQQHHQTVENHTRLALQSEAELLRLQELVAVAESAAFSANETVDALTQQYESQTNMVSEHQQQQQQLLEEHARSLSEREAELSSLQEQLVAAQTEIVTIERDSEKAAAASAQTISALCVDKEALQSASQTLRKEMAKLQSSLDDQNERVASLQQQLDESHLRFASLPPPSTKPDPIQERKIVTLLDDKRKLLVKLGEYMRIVRGLATSQHSILSNSCEIPESSTKHGPANIGTESGRLQKESKGKASAVSRGNKQSYSRPGRRITSVTGTPASHSSEYSPTSVDAVTSLCITDELDEEEYRFDDGDRDEIMDSHLSPTHPLQYRPTGSLYSSIEESVSMDREQVIGGNDRLPPFKQQQASLTSLLQFVSAQEEAIKRSLLALEATTWAEEKESCRKTNSASTILRNGRDSNIPLLTATRQAIMTDLHSVIGGSQPTLHNQTPRDAGNALLFRSRATSHQKTVLS